MKLKNILSVMMLFAVSIVFGQDTFKSCYVQGDSCYCVTYEKSIVETVVQNSCSGKHTVFNAPTNRKPKGLPRLGSNPQFETLRNYTTTQEVYDHLKRIYIENDKGNAAELDKLWKAMGYEGFNDATYTLDKVNAVSYDAGVSGMLGAGGNSYLYASIAPGTDQKFKGYKITSVNGCDVTIMEICGNAFYPSSMSNPTYASKTFTSGQRIVSKKAAAIAYPAGYSSSNSTVTTYMEDGQCKLRICKKPESKGGKAPVKISTLRHNQQFGSMVDLKTTDAVYGKLQSLHAENKDGNRAEIDRLLKTVGYTDGIKDSRFSTSSINIVSYAGGVAAVMGGGEHQYMYSEMSTKNFDGLRGFTIKSLNDECDLTIIDVCGNALYCPQPMDCQIIDCAACD
ncbi:MAG: hypothetical protein ACI97N_001009 [Cognaticolwellia sp.]|jgi:hypothetical protein